MIFSEIGITIDLETDPLLMRDCTNESSTGCVLRGVLNIHLKQPVKIKSVNLVFSGTLHADWAQLTVFGDMGRAQHDRSLIQHQWKLLPPPYAASVHSLPAGDHAYDFEIPLPSDLPLSSKIDTIYMVKYQLKATIERLYFLPNIEYQRNISLTRPLKSIPHHSIVTERRWGHRLIYRISSPSNIYHHSEFLPVTIQWTPLMRGVNIRHIDLSLVESSSCSPIDGLFNGCSRAYSETIYFHRSYRAPHKDPSDEHSWHWCFNIPIRKTTEELQYDAREPDDVHIRHHVKCVMSVETNQRQPPHTEKASLSIVILPKPTSEPLPTYYQRDQGKSYSYDPAVMVKLLQQRDQLRIKYIEN